MLILIVSLAAGLKEYRFRPGIPLPPREKPLETGWPVFSTAWFETVLKALRYAIFGLLGLGILGFAFRQNRRRFLWSLPALLFLAALAALSVLSPPFEETPVPGPLEFLDYRITSGEERDSAPLEAPEVAPLAPPKLPLWSVCLFLGGLALAMVSWLAWARRRSPKTPEEKSPLTLPSPPRAEGEVANMWLRMVAILLGKAGLSGIPRDWTARELGEFFFARFPCPAILELTGLFEEVRYGGRAEAELLPKACAALAEIEKAYAQP